MESSAADTASPRIHPPARPTPWTALVLALLIAFALGLQLARLDLRSAWDDEVGTIRIAGQPTIDALFDAYRQTERQPPLDYLVRHAWFMTVGTSDTAARLPSALFSVATVPALFWLGSRLLGRSVGLFAAGLAALSPFLVLYGRMARYYSLTLLLTVVTWGLLVEALRRPERARWLWPAWGVTLLLVLMTAYPALMVWLAQVCVVVALFAVRRPVPEDGKGSEDGPVLRPSSLGTWLVANCIVATLFLVWVAYDLSRFAGFTPEPSPLVAQGLGALVMKVLFPLYDYTIGETLFPWTIWAIVGLLGWTVALLVGTWWAWRCGRPGWLIVAGFVIPWLGTVMALQTVIRDLPFITVGTRAIAAFPFLLLIAALGLSRLRPAARYAATAGILVAAIAGDVHYFQGQQFLNPVYAVPTREVATEIAMALGPRDLVVADRDINLDRYLPTAFQNRYLDSSRTVEVIGQIESGQVDRVWLVTFGRDRTRALVPDSIRPALEARGRLVSASGYVPQDPTYSRLKERLQGMPDYEYKLLVEVFSFGPADR